MSLLELQNPAHYHLLNQNWQPTHPQVTHTLRQLEKQVLKDHDILLHASPKLRPLTTPHPAPVASSWIYNIRLQISGMLTRPPSPKPHRVGVRRRQKDK